MTNAEELEENELRATKYPKFRLLTGGKGPPDPPDVKDNWLAEYEEGTTFVTRSKRSKEVDLNLYHVLFKSLPEVMLLKWQLPDGKLLDYYVDPVRFSTQFERGTILGVYPKDASEAGLEEAAEADGGKDGKRNRTNRRRNLVLDASVSGEHQVVQSPKEPDL